MIDFFIIRIMFCIKGEFCRWEINRYSILVFKVTVVLDGIGKYGILEY